MKEGIPPPSVSLVIGTRGRTWQLERLLHSLSSQSLRSFAVTIVDQNPDQRLHDMLAAAWPFTIDHIHRPDIRGLSPARNIGWRAATGSVLLFPDDDSWYPGSFLERGIVMLNDTGADLLTGRSADETGRSINGRFAERPAKITRMSVWHMQQEWVTFVRRPLMERLGGYDELVGTGGPTPWQASEGPDLILRAIAAGALCRYDPSLIGHHEELSTVPNDVVELTKAIGYARGKGYVLRKHHRSPAILGWWLMRPLYPFARAVLARNQRKARYHLLQIIWRWRGWCDHGR